MRVAGKLMWLGLLVPVVAAAQARIVEKHTWSEPEGRIMGYYSAALAFTAIGAPGASARGLEAGLELTYLPPLSEEQRSGGFSKTESTNLMPIVPRPRLAYTMPWDTRFEASYVPPVKAFGVKASLLSVALSHPVFPGTGANVTVRIAGSSSMVTGPITCNKSMTEKGAGENLFFEKVCHGYESEDEFHAPAVSLELIGTRGKEGVIRPYVGLGVRTERDKFNIGVRKFSGLPDPDHPILEMSVTRPYGMLGASWVRSARSSVSGELFYAPGSVFTARLLGSMHVWGAK